jgi:predicted HTH domain antitoxin
MPTISFELPDDVDRRLRRELGDLDAVAKEAALVELYRQGQLSHGSLAESLRISRYETDALLKRHNVVDDRLTQEEFDEQLSGLRKSLGQ